MADSYSQELTKLLNKSAFDTLENWCIARINNFTEDLEKAVYLHEELSRYKLNSQHKLKDMKETKPSDLVAEKISFLMSLY